MFDRIREWLQASILADSEAASDREGYLSWRGEFHAAAWGLSAGFLAAYLNTPVILAAGVGWVFTRGIGDDAPSWLPYPRQFARESGYLVGHSVAGVVLGTIFRLFIL